MVTVLTTLSRRRWCVSLAKMIFHRRVNDRCFTCKFFLLLPTTAPVSLTACNLYSIEVWIQFHKLLHSLAFSKWMLYKFSLSFCFRLQTFEFMVQAILLAALFVFWLYYYHSLSCFFRRAPQQMLRTHRSLKAYCATLWWRWLVFSFFLVMEHRWNETDRGKPKYSGGKPPSATLSTINPTWTDAGSNPGLRSERPNTNRLSHGTAHFYVDVFWC
jgi:hypothetical protein